MARTFNEIFGESIKSVKELKAVIKDYQDSLIGVSADSEEFKKATEELAVAQEELTKVTKAGKQEMTAAQDSIVGMQKEYKTLYDQYKLLSEEQRNSDFGRSMAESLNTLSNKLNDTKKDVGNFKDNIGRYSDGVMEAFSKMGLSLGSFQAPFVALTKIVADGGKGIQDSVKGLTESVNGIGASLSSMGGPAKAASSAMKSVGSAMKALIANPVGATIMAIVVAFKALQAITERVKKAINDNEESQMALKETMSAFQPVLDAVSNAWDKVAQVVVKAIGFIGDAFSKMREIRAQVTDFLGITKGAAEQVKEQNELYKELAKSQNELTKQKREYLKLNSKDNAEVQRLRDEASETENVEEKKKKLMEAKALQEQIDQRNIEIAKEELRILEEQASLTANDAEMNDRLAQAVARVSDAEAQAASNSRRLNREIKAAGSSAKGSTASLKNYREEAKKLYQTLIEDNKTEIQKITEKYETEKKLLIKYNYDTTLLTKKYNEDIAKIRESDRATQVEKQKAALKQLSDFDKQYRDMLSGKYGDKSTELWIFDSQNYTKEANDIIRTLNKFGVDFNEIVDKINKAGTEGFGKTFLDGLKTFDTDFRERIELLNERWPELQLAPPPEFIAKEGDKIVDIQRNYNLWIDNVSKFLEVLQQKYRGLDRVDLQNESVLERSKETAKQAVTDYRRFIEDLEDLNTKASSNLFGMVDDEYGQKRAERNRKRAEEDATYYSTLIANEQKRLQENIERLRANYNSELENAQTKKQRVAIEKTMNLEIAKLEEESFNYRLGLEEEFYDAKARLRDMEIAAVELAATRTSDLWASAFESFDNVSSSITNVIGTISSLTQAEMQNGNLSEKEYKRKKKQLEDLAALQMAVSVASVTASSASAIMDVWKGYAAELKVNAETAAGTGPAAAITKAGLDAKSLASAILRTAGIGANAIAQIAAARGQYVSTVNNLQESGSGGGAASVTGIEEITSAPFTYTRQVQSLDEVDEMNRPIWISVQDIESALDRKATVREETSF